MSLATYASKTKKDLSFDDLAGPVKKKNGDPGTRPAITDTKYQTDLHKQIIATKKLTHFRSN